MADELSLKSVTRDALELQRVARVLGEKVEASFAVHPMREIPRSEIKRRLAIAVKWFREIRMQRVKPMGVDRALIEAGNALDAELGGRRYELPTSVLYTPDPR